MGRGLRGEPNRLLASLPREGGVEPSGIYGSVTRGTEFTARLVRAAPPATFVLRSTGEVGLCVCVLIARHGRHCSLPANDVVEVINKGRGLD